jgi:hypothetical protein
MGGVILAVDFVVCFQGTGRLLLCVLLRYHPMLMSLVAENAQQLLWTKFCILAACTMSMPLSDLILLLGVFLLLNKGRSQRMASCGVQYCVKVAVCCLSRSLITLPQLRVLLTVLKLAWIVEAASVGEPVWSLLLSPVGILV